MSGIEFVWRESLKIMLKDALEEPELNDELKDKFKLYDELKDKLYDEFFNDQARLYSLKCNECKLFEILLKYLEGDFLLEDDFLSETDKMRFPCSYIKRIGEFKHAVERWNLDNQIPGCRYYLSLTCIKGIMRLTYAALCWSILSLFSHFLGFIFLIFLIAFYIGEYFVDATTLFCVDFLPETYKMSLNNYMEKRIGESERAVEHWKLDDNQMAVCQYFAMCVKGVQWLTVAALCWRILSVFPHFLVFIFLIFLIAFYIIREYFVDAQLLSIDFMSLN